MTATTIRPSLPSTLSTPVTMMTTRAAVAITLPITPTLAAETGVTPGGGATTGGGTNPVPVAATTGDDADDAEDEEAIEEDETPLADGAETDADGEEIADDDTPLTSGETNDQTCMMHWAMLAGIAASAVYFVLSAVNTRRATSKLASFEDDVLGRR